MKPLENEHDDNNNENDVVILMTTILGTILALIVGLISIQEKKDPSSKSKSNGGDDGSSFLPCPKTEPSKYAYELYVWHYTPIWIFLFGLIVIFQLYEQMTKAWHYNFVCGILALPFVLQPLIKPSGPDRNKPLLQRYSFHANVWIAVFSFIGNYFYTHYFYCVLKAKYTMPSTRLNNVPIAMYFATHFYFSTYHVLSNSLLRKIETTYVETKKKSKRRISLFIGVILGLSYFTAFMETLTISNFPYYSFEDRNMAYTIGSAFYGIYFIVSFPMFYYFLKDIDDSKKEVVILSVWDTIVHSCGCGMVVLILLDIVRLFVGVPFVMDI